MCLNHVSPAAARLRWTFVPDINSFIRHTGIAIPVSNLQEVLFENVQCEMLDISYI